MGERIVDYIKRAIYEMRTRCAEPYKIQMSVDLFYIILEECTKDNELVTVEIRDGMLVYKLCDIEIERRPDMVNGTIYIASERG